jgi:glycine/D-amino acid oxidase-like deaminating enzyme
MGAGITGAIIADALARTGLKVAVVDKRGLAKGSTLASTALVQHEIDTPLITLTRARLERTRQCAPGAVHASR